MNNFFIISGINDTSDEYPVCIECENGKKFYAEMCLVTISLGYLKLHAGRLFDPPLPESKLEAIHRVAMGTVNKIILEFDDQILPTGVFRLEMVWTHEPEEGTDISETWIRKMPSFEAVGDNVLMGKLDFNFLDAIQVSFHSTIKELWTLQM